MRLVVLLVLASVALGMDCIHINNDFHATYNLNALKLFAPNEYIVRDSRDDQRNYTYYFNVCDNVASPHTSCDDLGPGTVVTAPAFQVSPTETKCHMLGNLTDVFWNLTDPLDPADGVRLTYFHGDWCGGHNRHRHFEIRFICVDRVIAPYPVQRVTEDECRYTLEFETHFACPQECPFAAPNPGDNPLLCGGHGFCGYDTDKQKPRCFCNKGHSGLDCLSGPVNEESAPASCDGVCATVAVILVIMGLLLIAAIFMWYRLQKLDKMNVRFSALSDSFNNPNTAHEVVTSAHTDNMVISMRGDIPPQPAVTSGPSSGNL